MPTTHIVCSNCKGEFDSVMSAESCLVHAPETTEIITSKGEKIRTTSIKVFNRHMINCP